MSCERSQSGKDTTQAGLELAFLNGSQPLASVLWGLCSVGHSPQAKGEVYNPYSWILQIQNMTSTSNVLTPYCHFMPATILQ